MSRDPSSTLLRPWGAGLLLAVLGFAVGWFAHATLHRDHAGRIPPASAVRAVAPRTATSAAAGAGSPATRHGTADTGADPAAEWTRLSAVPRTPAVERELSGAIEALAGTDPERAMALAKAEPNLRMREQLVAAVLRGWATTDAEGALAAAMQLQGSDNRPAIQAVLAGAARHPDEAVRLAQKLCGGADLPLATEYGSLAIQALSDAGAFAAAAQFAAAGPAEARASWLNVAYAQWALHQPEAALGAVAAISDPALRREAFEGVVNGWSDANPGALAAYAANLPPGNERSLALSQALPNWVNRDPVAATDWLDRFGPDPALDNGVATIAVMPNLVAQRPDLAVEWAQTIVDADVRARTLQQIAEQWAKTAPEAFQGFLRRNAGRLSGADQRALLDGATPNPGGRQ